MLGDVGDPQLIWCLAGEHPLHQITRCRRLVPGTSTPVARQPLYRGAGHQRLDLVVANRQPQSEGEFGVDAPDAVRAARGGVHRPDLVGEPGVTHCPC
jgi:hypothetical protein